MLVHAGDSDSKTTCKNVLFLCPGLAGGCSELSELADVVSVGGLKTSSLGASELV